MVALVVVALNSPMFARLEAPDRKLSTEAKVAVNCAVVLPTLAKVTAFLWVDDIISPGNVVAVAPGTVPEPMPINPTWQEPEEFPNNFTR